MTVNQTTRSTRLAVLVGLAFLVSLMVPPLGGVGESLAGTSDEQSSSKRSKAKQSKAERGKRSKRRAKRVARSRKRSKSKRRNRTFRGHAVDKGELRDDALPRPSGEIWLYAENFREEVRVNIYDSSSPGEYRFDDAALAKLDRLFRCKRTGEERAVDPRLYEVLSLIADNFGQKRIELVSGFRFQENESSRHYHASAVDFRIKGIGQRAIYRFAETLDRGNMGIGLYPRSGFVHVDFRAPGEPSYRWTDRSGPGKKSKGKRPSRRYRDRRSKRPNS